MYRNDFDLSRNDLYRNDFVSKRIQNRRLAFLFVTLQERIDEKVNIARHLCLLLRYGSRFIVKYTEAAKAKLKPQIKAVIVQQSAALRARFTMGAFHLVNNSGNSGSGLNEKRFFGSPDWKIPRKSRTAQKVVPFSRLERPYWFLVFQLHLPGNLYQFQAHGNRIANKMATEMMYQCSCCFLTTHSNTRVVQYTQLESIRLWYLRFDKPEIDS